MDFNEMVYLLCSDYTEECPAFVGCNDAIGDFVEWLFCHYFED